MAAIKQKYIFYLAVLILFACSNPVGTINPTRVFRIILESDLDYAIVKSDGTVWIWGGNSTGQLGNGTITPSEQPVNAINLKDVISLDLRDGAANAADENGNIWFWGYKLLWEYDTVVVVPKKISSLIGIKQLQAIGNYIDLLKEDGTVWRIIWEYNYPTHFLYHGKINDLDNIIKISGYLALKDNGELCEFPDCAGMGPENGGLGDEIISGIMDLQNSYMSHTIILRNDSTVWAWGRNKGGYLGNGSFDDNPVPSKIDTLNSVIAISANGSHCLALKKDGSVWFWGMVYVDLDQGIRIYQNKPICIEELNDVKIIHASAAGTLLFMKSDASFWSYDIYSKDLKMIQL